MITRNLVHSVGYSPVFKIVLQTEIRTSIMASPTLKISDDMLSNPAVFPSSARGLLPEPFLEGKEEDQWAVS